MNARIRKKEKNQSVLMHTHIHTPHRFERNSKEMNGQLIDQQNQCANKEKRKEPKAFTCILLIYTRFASEREKQNMKEKCLSHFKSGRIVLCLGTKNRKVSLFLLAKNEKLDVSHCVIFSKFPSGQFWYFS
jgi:hypothetical protein